MWLHRVNYTHFYYLACVYIRWRLPSNNANIQDPRPRMPHWMTRFCNWRPRMRNWRPRLCNWRPPKNAQLEGPRMPHWMTRLHNWRSRMPYRNERLNQFEVGVYHQVDCAICLDKLSLDRKECVIPPCDHIFHYDCFMDWYTRQSSCPVCRTRFEGLHEDPDRSVESHWSFRNTPWSRIPFQCDCYSPRIEFARSALAPVQASDVTSDLSKSFLDNHLMSQLIISHRK